jgi:FtsP/CotA-like multicopper oxidase with cupredoxin domain
MPFVGVVWGGGLMIRLTRRLKVGTYAHWRVTNATNEIHPFHIHQVHFLVYEQAGTLLRRPEWMVRSISHQMSHSTS